MKSAAFTPSENVADREPRRVAVLFVGEADWPEFRGAHEWLRGRSRLTTVANLTAAAEELGRGCDPELIVLAQSWPGQLSPGGVERLRRLAPLARVSELLGAWCEGQARSGSPLPGTIRQSWHQWLARMTPDFQRAARGEQPTWCLPATAGDDERLLAAAQPQPQPARGLIAIHSRHAETAHALCDACPTRGFSGIWLRPRGGPYLAGIRGAIWDSPRGWTAAECAGELAALRQGVGLGEAPIVALVDFPRVEDCRHLTAAGAAAVVSRPFWLDDLFGQLDRLISRTV